MRPGRTGQRQAQPQQAEPRGFGSSILRLQAVAGNRAVSRLVERAPASRQPFELGELGKALQAMAAASRQASAPAGATSGPPVVQRSLISFLVKMGAKKVSKGTLKNFLKTQIKGKLGSLVSKNARKRFAKEADDILAALDDPWWATAIGFVPIVGDAFDLGRLPFKIKRAFERAERLGDKLDALRTMQKAKAVDLLPGTLKRSKSYADELADKTYGELLKMAEGGSTKAAKMTKLIEQQARLMGKL